MAYPADHPNTGSSPRIRGKYDEAFDLTDAERIIPANTGKIGRRLRGFQTRRDHPREYGENMAALFSASTAGGSSPRIRGKFTPRGTRVSGLGIIPANTGKIRYWHRQGWHGWDHPREYGENKKADADSTGGVGSSPRIRGKLIWCLVVAHVFGIIPANTGKIGNPRRKCNAFRDHPREYGENAGEEFFVEYRKGIIPANTGKMRAAHSQQRAHGDHPREYGENPTVRSLDVAGQGSSPRIRGKYYCDGA